MNSSISNSFLLNLSISKKSKPSFNTSRKKTVVNHDLSRSTLNQTAKIRTKYKRIQQLNNELAIENAKLKIENNNIQRENNLLRQAQVFGVVPTDKMKKFIDRASESLMTAVDELCQALELCKRPDTISNLPEETPSDIVMITEKGIETNLPVDSPEIKLKKFHGQPKKNHNVKFDLFEPINEHDLSDFSNLSDLPELLFIDQNKDPIIGKENKSLNERTKSDSSIDLNNTLKASLCRTSGNEDVEAPVIEVLPSEVSEIVQNGTEDSETQQSSVNMLGEEIRSLPPDPKANFTFGNQTNYNTSDMELTEVLDIIPFAENTPVIPTNSIPLMVKIEKEQKTKDSIKRKINDSLYSPEVSEDSDPDFVPGGSKRPKRRINSQKNFTFFDTKTKKVAPKAKSSRKSKRVVEKNENKEDKSHDIFDLSCSLNKSSFIKPYSPRPKKNPSNATEDTLASRLCVTGAPESDSYRGVSAKPKAKSRKLNKTRTSKESTKTDYDSDSDGATRDAITKKNSNSDLQCKTKSAKSRAYISKTGNQKCTTKNNSDSDSDRENIKTPDTVVKKTTVKKRGAQKTILPDTDKTSKGNQKPSVQSPSVTPFVAKENVGKAKKKLRLTRTKPKVKEVCEEIVKNEISPTSTVSRESIQYDPSVPINLRSSSEGVSANVDDGFSTSGRPKRAPPKSYKSVPLNKKLRREN